MKKKNYPNNSKIMSQEFLNLFTLYMDSKKEIINQRSSKNINMVKNCI